MKKIKEFFEWLDNDESWWVAGCFVISCIVALIFTLGFLFVKSPLVFLTLIFAAVVFFILYPIYLFHKENKDAPDS